MSLLNDYDIFIFDLDGVIYLGDKATPGAVEVIERLNQLKKKYFFITNNPSRSPNEYQKKLAGLNINSQRSQIITSCHAVLQFLKSNFPDIEQKSIYVIGSRYLKNTVKKTNSHIAKDPFSEKIDIVVVGGHSKFNYKEIKNASVAIRKGAFFLATNKDPFYPTDKGFFPATGALIASIEVASETKAHIAGKPESYIFRYCLDRNKGRTIIVGDNLETDIKGGLQSGIDTALVLTGYSKEEDVEKTGIKPKYIIENLLELLK